MVSDRARGPGGAVAVWLLASPLTALAQSSDASIPYRVDASDGLGILRVVVALALCLVVYAGVLYAVRRWGGRVGAAVDGLSGKSTAPRVRVVQRERLSARMALAVVEFEGEHHLIAHGDQVLVVIAPRRGESAVGAPARLPPFEDAR